MIAYGAVMVSQRRIVNEPIWEDRPYAGTHPVQRTYSHNLDFSTFPLLCERAYADLEIENSRLRRKMTFAAFQHVTTSILNIVIVDHIRTVNAEDRYAVEMSPMNLIPDDICIPAPVMEYFKAIANTTTPQGDRIKMDDEQTNNQQTMMNMMLQLRQQISDQQQQPQQQQHENNEDDVKPLRRRKYHISHQTNNSVEQWICVPITTRRFL